MNRLILILIFALSINMVKAQNHAPVVENVRFEQRTDESFVVDVYYNVNDSDGNTMTVTMQVSNDAGVSWDFSCTQITSDSDIGNGITSGTNRHIIWNFGTEHPEYFSDQIQIKIIADDGISVGGQPCPDIPTIAYEGKTYNTVQIEDQCWLKENLDVGTLIFSSSSNDNQTNNGIIEKYCYNNEIANCEIFGGLYQWSEAMCYTSTDGTQGICPDGWHIPKKDDYQILIASVAGRDALLAIGQISGNDESGFSAILAGGRSTYLGGFGGLGITTSFWSSTEGNSTAAYYINLHYSDVNVNLQGTHKNVGSSIRCIKD